MKEGDVVIALLPQSDGTLKRRPAVILRLMPPFGDFLLCGISTQIHQKVTGFDDVISPSDTEFCRERIKIRVSNSFRFSDRLFSPGYNRCCWHNIKRTSPTTFAKFKRLFNQMIYRIEKAVERDVPQIIALIREFAGFEELSDFCEVTEEKLTAAMFGEKPCVEGLMAFDEKNEAVGYALFYENFASFRGQRGVYLEDLYIVPRMRKSGVGLSLLQHLARLAASRGCERMDWQVLTWNDAAIRFYQKIGAEIDESERHWKIVGADFARLTQ